MKYTQSTVLGSVPNGIFCGAWADLRRAASSFFLFSSSAFSFSRIAFSRSLSRTAFDLPATACWAWIWATCCLTLADLFFCYRQCPARLDECKSYPRFSSQMSGQGRREASVARNHRHQLRTLSTATFCDEPCFSCFFGGIVSGLKTVVTDDGDNLDSTCDACYHQDKFTAAPPRSYTGAILYLSRCGDR